MIICGDPEFTEDSFDTIKNPSVIFEVISKTSEANDRRKFFYYMQIPSVKTIVMINSFEGINVEVSTRQENGSWQLTTYNSLENSFFLLPDALELSLSEIYQDVKLSL
jgi:Uma2 family endonuclease